MHAVSPPGQAFALDLSGLRSPGITVWSAWDSGIVLGVGALKELGDRRGEIKSMRTHPDHLRKGVGTAILDHLIAEARLRGLTCLSLETGTGPIFEPALAMYRSRGFRSGAAFADYDASAFNQFMHLSL
ncbi:GNAT family N-acetyltransferase [Chelatococcus reniformis]|uniref:N-acetyltransferase n=1 Tax=Chelatococcus reniformis TaxID=1494448 RepID=A0A916TZV6_9HYPH|nr:GNAT family N-acetyltransferase [Chelatococcus reniformis]GGC53633.1 N-acetyltransferase [Chelatococcus reniformis]